MAYYVKGLLVLFYFFLFFNEIDSQGQNKDSFPILMKTNTDSLLVKYELDSALNRLLLEKDKKIAYLDSLNCLLKEDLEEIKGRKKKNRIIIDMQIIDAQKKIIKRLYLLNIAELEKRYRMLIGDSISGSSVCPVDVDL